MARVGDFPAPVKGPDFAFFEPEYVLEQLQTGFAGLSAEDAAKRLIRHGRNSIEIFVPSSLFRKLSGNFFHAMAVLLWLTGLVALAAKMPELAIAIWLVNIVNGSFSFWQENCAQKALEALNKLLPVNVQVVRSSLPVNISASDLVPGDIVLLNEGDRVSADMRILSCQSLEIDQSILTGESRPVRKQAATLERQQANGVLNADFHNLVFAGTMVLTGHAQAVVFATGTNTEFGKIANLAQTIVDQPSPLQKEMERLSRTVSAISIAVGAAMFMAAKLLAHTETQAAFMFALGMIVAFVPEGMVPTVTLSLALAVQRMVKRNALVKRLSSVEALGSCSIICTDKTGTITENKMTVTRAFAGGAEFQLTGLGYSFEGTLIPGQDSGANSEIFELLKAGVWCNNARIELPPSNYVSGDPTEVALLVAAGKAGQPVKCMAPRLHENIFDSRRKSMSTVHDDSGSKVAYIKGSAAHIIANCRRQLIGKVELELTEEQRAVLIRRVDSYAEDGLRVIAAARNRISENSKDFSAPSVETDACFIGLFAMYDPPRRGVAEAVAKCKRAGIQVVMITGDYEITARAIARKVGIIESDSPTIFTGAQLDRISDDEFIESLREEVVFARVNPDHKLRIVQAFQRCGRIVAVTGDGVNDAPALKSADIGVAMGQNGADVAKESADMILLDDNFASIVSAIEEGRCVYDNIRKFAVYVFNSNMAEAVPFVVMLFSCGLIPLPLTVMQVLCIDLGTDMLPALGLGVDPAEPGIMHRVPRNLNEPLLTRALLAKALLWYGAIEAIAGMSGYFFLNWLHGWPTIPLAQPPSVIWKMATSMTLSCIVCAQVGAVFCCRTDRASIFSVNLLENRLVVAGVFVEILLLLLLLFFPFANQIFGTAPLGFTELLYAACWIPIVVALDEIRKLYLRKSRGFRQAER